MNKRDKHVGSILIGFILVLQGLLSLLSDDRLFNAPIFIALGIILVISSIFEIKKYHNRTIYTSIVGVILAMMLIGEYFLVPTGSTIFYVLIVIMTVTLFIPAYILFIPEGRQNKTEKTLSLVGLTIFFLELFILYGVVYNDFKLSLYVGVFVLLTFLIVFLIRKWRFGKAF